MTKRDVLEFVRKHDLAVVATVDGQGKPQAAVVEFAELDDFTIIIDTLKASRKYENLQTNREVAIVIGWDDDATVQMDAVAHELTGQELDRAKEVYFAKNPRAKKWGNKPGIAYFAFQPSWLRYSDVGQHPWIIEEFSF